jgi:hypothetical protein
VRIEAQTIVARTSSTVRPESAEIASSSAFRGLLEGARTAGGTERGGTTAGAGDPPAGRTVGGTPVTSRTDGSTPVGGRTDGSTPVSGRTGDTTGNDRTGGDAGKRPVVTPFGPDFVSGSDPGIRDAKPGDKGMSVYFRTHQPGEWMYNPAARAAFAELYGAKALVTLDWTGTVPDNVDPMWVTKVPVDATGRPLPPKNDLRGKSSLT